MNKLLNAFNTFLFLTFLCYNCIHSQGVWTQKENFGGTARSNAIGFSIGDKGYMGCGRDANQNFLRDFWEYNPQNNTWSQKANLGFISRSSGIGFSIGDKGYAGLGISNSLQGLSDFWEYDPVSNSWTQKAFYLGTGIASTVAFSINNLGYVGTGSPSGQIGNETKEFWEYNPLYDNWVRKADFGGNVRDRAAGFSLGNKGYIGTGYHFNGTSPVVYSDFWEYNQTNDTWTEKSSLQALERDNAIGFSTSSSGYIGMGYLNKTDFWKYNPAEDLWTQVANFSSNGRIFASGFAIQDKGYVGLGYIVDSQGQVTFNDLWEYTEETLGSNNNYLSEKLAVFPNPSSDFINIPTNLDIIDITIYDLNGKEIFNNIKSFSIDIRNLEIGIYFLKIKTSKEIVIEKFIKK